jgi:hypothetical protein
MAERQHVFAITSQKLDTRAKDENDVAPCMELVPPSTSPGPWEVVSWKYDPAMAMAGRIHVVWRHG